MRTLQGGQVQQVAQDLTVGVHSCFHVADPRPAETPVTGCQFPAQIRADLPGLRALPALRGGELHLLRLIEDS